MPAMNLTLAAATAAYDDATARLRTLDSNYAASQRESAKADSKAATILSEAAKGRAVTTADVLKVRQAAETARTNLDVAEALRQAAQTTVDQAEVAWFEAEATAQAFDEGALMTEALNAASAVDAAVAAAQRALADLSAVEARFSNLRARVRNARYQLDAACRRNTVLMARHSSLRPQFRQMEAIGFPAITQLSVAVLRQAAGASPEWQDNRLRGDVQTFIGLAPVDPAVQAAQDAAAKLAAAGNAFLAAAAAGSARREASRSPDGAGRVGFSQRPTFGV